MLLLATCDCAKPGSLHLSLSFSVAPTDAITLTHSHTHTHLQTTSLCIATPTQRACCPSLRGSKMLLGAARSAGRACASSAQAFRHQLGRASSSAPHADTSSDADSELQSFREHVKAFAQSTVAPHAEQIDRANSFPSDGVDLWREMGSFGLLGER